MAEVPVAGGPAAEAPVAEAPLPEVWDNAPLTALLRQATAQEHADLEAAPFSMALVHGRVSPAAVAALLDRLLPVYVALEHAAAGHLDDPAIGPLCCPLLGRAARLAADLAVLPPPAATPEQAAASATAATAYAERVAAVAADPLAVVAHCWTRYLGDLSGGRFIAAALERSLGLVPDRGGSFFAVPAAPRRRAQQYRAGLDALRLDGAQRRELCGEAVLAHRLNGALLAELAGLAQDRAPDRPPPLAVRR